MGRKGVVIPVSQKADVKPRGYEREFIGEKKMFTKERREGAGPNCQVQRMPDARERRKKEKVARVP